MVWSRTGIVVLTGALTSWPRWPHVPIRTCWPTRNDCSSTSWNVCSLVTSKTTMSRGSSCTYRRAVHDEVHGNVRRYNGGRCQGEAYKSLPAAAYGDEVGGRRVESVPSGIYPPKEGVTVVVSAAHS